MIFNNYKNKTNKRKQLKHKKIKTFTIIKIEIKLGSYIIL